MSWYYNYKPSKPIQTQEGIKTKSQRGDFVKNWWATRWIEAVERVMDAGRLRRGRSYARAGQVLAVEESAGGVTARVQGSRRTPYKVTIEVKPLSDAQWTAVFSALSERAIFTAELLNGQMPQNIEEAFAAAGVSLFPGRGELTAGCSCPDWASVCKHIAAAQYILAERFDDDPFLLFRLRGRTQEQALAALRAQHGPADDEPQPEAETAAPLTALLDDYWRAGGGLAHFPVEIKPPVTPLPALRRLGQPGFVSDDLERLLGPAYELMTETAVNTAFGAEEA